MMLSPDLRATLHSVAEAMTAAQDDWWIISSAAVALHVDQPIAVGDVDVLLSPDDARRLFPTLGIAPLTEPGNDLFRSSLFGRWDAPPLTVEFMADFHFRDQGRWTEVLPDTRECIMLDGTALFAPIRDELRMMLLAFGRPKDLARAALL